MRGRIGGAVLALGLCLLLAPMVHAASGNECSECHGDIVTQFGSSPHGRAYALDPDQAGADCASCHGSGTAHAQGGGDVALIAMPGSAACLKCHENHASQAWWRGSAHETAGLSCTECHDVHAAGHSHGGTTDKCLSCHTTFRKHLNQRSTHPLRDGQMDCASCHNPHGGSNEHMIDADSINDLCFSCHQEKRGPFLWEHSPVREDCLTCHTAHGSNHPGLLVARTAQLCQACHLQGRHQSVAGTETTTWNTNRQCLNCHPNIHGSNHPSGPLFMR